MGLCYPLSVEDQRTLPDGYDGPAFVWDLDKTYLSTAFSSLRGMLRIPLEFAVDKLSIPGMPEILRGLRRGSAPGFACLPLYFVTASPPQLRKAVENKMLLDAVEYDGITCKDWWAALRQGKPQRLRDQVGFKICALLDGRQRRPMAREYLFGDDVEKDPVAFQIYALLINGALSAGEAQSRMVAEGVSRDDRACVFDLLSMLPRNRGKVRSIFIHLEKGTPPAAFESLGPVVVPVRGAFQLGLALYGEGLVDRRTVLEARAALGSGFLSADGSAHEAVADAVERGLISEGKLKELGL
ncbi:MAG: hypothetical protein AB1640_16855 [bacterium]